MAQERIQKPKSKSTKTSAAKAADQEVDTRTPGGTKLPY